MLACAAAVRHARARTDRRLHLVAGAFFHGREEILPRSFLPLVRELENNGVSCTLLRRYLERHVEIDQSSHGPLAQRLLDFACEGRADRRDQATAAGLRALQARIDLWDAMAVGCQRQPVLA